MKAKMRRDSQDWNTKMEWISMIEIERIRETSKKKPFYLGLLMFFWKIKKLPIIENHEWIESSDKIYFIKNSNCIWMRINGQQL